MQIQKLNIDSYRHLQNLNFDFTYPEGHEKAGKPLEKICLIGQSATGKTTVLELMKNNILELSNMQIVSQEFFTHHFSLAFDGELNYLYYDKLIEIKKDTIVVDKKKISNWRGNISGSAGYLLPNGLKLIYLSSEIITKELINTFDQNPLNFLNKGFQKIQFGTAYVYEFTHEVNAQVWFSLLYNVLDYRKRFNQWASELLSKGVIGDLTKLNRQIARWNETNENPLFPFANAFNPILEKLNLEVDLISTEYSVPIKSKFKDEVIPITSLSTGTKGLLLSMFPLYELDTKDAMILIDEPERSLFPDMQIDLISHYKRLAPEAQIIVATHSPFIAAAFEPEERFILYFDETGNVRVRRGESPIGDDPNDILSNDFNVDYYNDFGKQAYKDYINLKAKVAQESEPEVKKKLIVEMSELGDRYNF